MKLTKRLNTIVSLVDKDCNVVDIGCDHALIDIYLTLYNNNNCIASDVNENALYIAKENIKKYNLCIETVLSDGFKNIEVKKNTTAIIAGMGTLNIIKILENANLNNIDNIIIQSNTNLYDLRCYLYKIGYYILEEKIVYEKNIYYVIIKFKKGRKKISEEELKFGPIIIKGKNEIKRRYFKQLIDTKNDIINNTNDDNLKCILREEILFLDKNT